MTESAMPHGDLRTPLPEIGQGKRARLARMVRGSGVLPVLQRARDAWRGGLRILAYHRILESAEPAGFVFDPGLISASASAFNAQMAHVSRHYRPMTLAQALATFERGEPLPARALMVTFDDGYEDNHRIALPILRKHGVPATFFVSTAHIESGEPYAFDWLYHMVCTTSGRECRIPALEIDAPVPSSLVERRRLAAWIIDRTKSLDAYAQADAIAGLQAAWGMRRPPSAPECRPMDWDQVRALRAAGMEIGSHGMWHKMLAKLSDRDLEAELSGSRDALQAQLDCPVHAISYPVGGHDAFDSRVIQAATSNGFRIGCSYIRGVDRPTAGNIMSLRRIPVERDMDLAWFEALLALPETFTYVTKHRVD